MVTGNDGDDSVTFTYTPSPLAADANHAWHVSATDLAGNTGVSDADPDNNDPVDTQDDHIVTVDQTAPAMVAAETGRWWDNTASVEKSNKPVESQEVV